MRRVPMPPSFSALFTALFTALLTLSACQSAPKAPQSAPTEALTAKPEHLLKSKSSLPLHVSAKDMSARLQGAPGVKKWEPSGVALSQGKLWVVSDKDGWLASYPLPLKAVSEPSYTAQLKTPLDNRLKWEGLEAHPEGGLLLMEAISRSVWWCKSPSEGCPQLKRYELQATNNRLNELAGRPFYYIMFEALTFIDGAPWVGVRGMNAKPSADHEGGLLPWIAWLRAGELSPQAEAEGLIPPQGTLEQSAFKYQGRSYGLSGAVRDGAGLWVTLSYEDEDGDSASSVSGLLAYLKLPLSSDSLTGASPRAKICAEFELKPEGVTLLESGAPLVVFDVDADRKGDRPDQFQLKLTEDYAWVAPSSLSSCAQE